MVPQNQKLYKNKGRGPISQKACGTTKTYKRQKVCVGNICIDIKTKGVGVCLVGGGIIQSMPSNKHNQHHIFSNNRQQ